MSGPLSNPFMFKSSAAADFYDYQITRSLRFNGTDQALEKTWGASATNDDAKAISVWIKRSGAGGTNSEIGSTTNTKICSANDFNQLEINTGNPSGFSDQFGYFINGASNAAWYKGKWRDPSAWLHIVWIYNSDESTTTDRVKVYFNGVAQPIGDSTLWNYTNGDVDPYPPSGTDCQFGLNTKEMHIARYQYDDGGWWGGQMADFIMIDGTASISDFGETKNGVWKPVDPSGLTFGNNGFWLKFTNTSNPGEDFSGNDNDFTTIGTIPAHDFLLDSPTFDSSSNGGNFCTLNPITDAVNMTLSEGNLTWTTSTSNRSINANFKLPAGTGQKWYWEHRMTSWAGSESDDIYLGINVIQPDWDSSSTRGGGNTGNSYGAQGYKNVLGTDTTSYGDQIDTGDVWGVAVDLENNTIQFYKEGSAQGAAWSISGTTEWYPWVGSGGGSNSASGTFNFGQNGTFNGTETAGGNSDANGYGNFYSTVPTGFKALCAANLPVVDEVDPAQTDDNYPQKLFGVTTWTGDGNTSRAITGLGFQPDWLWFKARDSAFSHRIYDTSRGIASDGGKRLFTNTTAVENDQTSGQDISAVGSDGFTLGASSANYTNDTNNDAGHVNFAWRVNGGTTSTNSNGDTDSTVQVDPSGHFSIVLGTGDNDSWGNAQTFGHGLSAAPTCIIGKQRADNADEWQVFFSDYGNATIGGSTAADNSMVLNSTAAIYTNQSYKGWGGVMPTSTVFTLDGNNLVGDTHTFVCYCFANCEGYIKSGAYEGNGDADGTFVYTGFKPAWLMIKQVNSTSNWNIFDTTRDPYNYTSKHVAADTSAVEYDGSSYSLDILSNGFKMVSTWSQINGNGSDYVFLAMAHNPFKYATAR